MARLQKLERKRLALGVGASVALATITAQAECRLELVPHDAPVAWTAVAGAAGRRLASASAHDCQSVEVAVRPSGGALVTFITTDGRRGVRALMSPEELEPALDALLVTLPPESSAAAAAARPPAAVAVLPTSPAIAAADVAPPTSVVTRTAASPARDPEVHFRIGVSAGARFGFGGAYASPALGLRPSGAFGRWELSGALEYDPAYAYLPGGSPPGFKLWSFIAAVQVGRILPLGRVALSSGFGLGVASIREEAKDANGTAAVADFGQPRVSAYGRVAFPRQSTWKATLGLDLDAVLGSIKRRASLRNDLPNLPRWGATISVGVETTAL